MHYQFPIGGSEPGAEGRSGEDRRNPLHLWHALGLAAHRSRIPLPQRRYGCGASPARAARAAPVCQGNAITAATLLEFDIAEKDVLSGLRHAVWPARLERVIQGPRFDLLPPEWELWVDGGHNMAAGHMLASFIEEQWQDKPTYIVFGTTQGKDVMSLLIPLAGKVQEIVATPVISEPKSYSAEAIIDVMKPIGCPISGSDGVEDAIVRIVENKPAPGRILVFGSLYLRVLVA
jgi:folylpolyglutamate synthase/dihydropteroate synthase